MANLPEPPAARAGTLFGVPPGRPRAVPAELSAAHAAEEQQWAHGQLLERYGEAGGTPQPGAGSFATLGPAPTAQVRRVFVAKFDPGAATAGRFAASDPDRAEELWDFSGPPQNWIGDAPPAPGTSPRTRTAQAHADIAAGDLVVVFRGAPRVGPRRPGRLDTRPHLIGVWWVTHVHRRWLPWFTTRPVTDVWHAPLARFTTAPVDVPAVRARHVQLAELAAFTDSRQQALLGTTPAEAAALTAACSLPGWVLTDPDPVSVARRLAGVRTGMRPADVAAMHDLQARYKYIHAIETAASHRVQRELLAASWSVISRERCLRWGADLDAWRRRRGGQLERRAVEVKGKAGPAWRAVVLQESQYRRARDSAAAGDDEWWLAICTQVLQPAPPPVRQLSADWVAAHWPRTRVRRAAVPIPSPVPAAVPTAGLVPAVG